MTMYLWLKLLAFGCAFLDIGAGTCEGVIFSLAVRCLWRDIGLKQTKINEGLMTESEEAH